MAPQNQLPNSFNSGTWYYIILGALGLVSNSGKKVVNHFEQKVPWKVLASIGAATALFLAGHGMSNTLSTIQTHSAQLAPLMAMPEQVKDIKTVVCAMQQEIKADHEKKTIHDNEQDKCLTELKTIMRTIHPNSRLGGGEFGDK